ncbi:MAG: redoxin domain-containing protein [Myxococcota bacterium]
MRHVARPAIAALFAFAACARPPAATKASAPVAKQVTPPARSEPSSAPSAVAEASPDAAEDEAKADSEAPAWLGVELAMRLPEDPGVLVRSVVPGSPAERAGVLAGDVILSVEGQNVSRPSELVAEIAGRRAGQRVALGVLRHGDNRLFAAVLEALPNEEALMKKRYLDQAAPGLGELVVVQGNTDANLRTLRGRVVVIEFWATWCAPCRLTAPLLSNWSDRHAAEGLSVLGITSDPAQIAADGARRASMSYSVFSDTSGDTVRTYRAFALPTLFVLDRRGVVRDIVVGYSSVRLRQIDQLIGRLLAER